MSGVFQRLFGLGAVLDFNSGTATEHMGTAERAAGSLRRGLGDVGKGAREAVGGLGQFAIATLPLYAALGLGVKQAAEFEHGMARIGTLLDDQGLKRLPMLSDAINDMTVKYGIAADTLQQAEFQALSANVPLEQSVKFLELAAEAATGGFTEVSVVVDGLTNVLNAYGLGIDQARSVSDAFFVANRRGKTTVGELASTLGQVAPIARQLQVDFRDLTASVATVTKGGLQTSVVVTGLRGMFAALIKPTSEAAEEAQRLGLAFGPDAIRRAGGFLPFLQQVAAKTKGEVGSVSKLFGQIEAMPTILGLLTGEGRADLAAGLAEMAGGGQTERAFQLVQQSAQFQFQQLKQMALSFLRGLGEALLPLVSETIQPLFKAVEPMLWEFLASFKTAAGEVGGVVQEYILPAIRWVKEAWDGLSEDTRVGLAKAVLLIAGAGAAIAGIAAVVGPVVVAVSGLWTAAEGAGGALAAIFSPPTLAALGAVVAIAVVLAERWDEVTRAATEFGAGFSTVMGQIAHDTRQDLLPALQETWDLIKQIIGTIIFDGPKANASWEEIGQTVGKVVHYVIQAGTILIRIVGAVIETIWNNLLQPLWSTTKNFWTGLIDLVTGNFASGLEKMFVGIVGGLFAPFQFYVRRLLMLVSAAINEFIGMANSIPGVHMEHFPLIKWPERMSSLLDQAYGGGVKDWNEPWKKDFFQFTPYKTETPGAAPEGNLDLAAWDRTVAEEAASRQEAQNQRLAATVAQATAAAIATNPPKVQVNMDGRKVDRETGRRQARENARTGRLLNPSERARLLRGSLILSVGQ